MPANPITLTNTSHRSFQRSRDRKSTHRSSNSTPTTHVSIVSRLRHCCESSRRTRKYKIVNPARRTIKPAGHQRTGGRLTERMSSDVVGRGRIGSVIVVLQRSPMDVRHSVAVEPSFPLTPALSPREANIENRTLKEQPPESRGLVRSSRNKSQKNIQHPKGHVSRRIR